MRRHAKTQTRRARSGPRVNPMRNLIPFVLLVTAFATFSLPVAPAQTVPPVAEEVLCPIFIPEAPVKYCIQITGRGCVIVDISTFGVPTNPEGHQKLCP